METHSEPFVTHIVDFSNSTEFEMDPTNNYIEVQCFPLQSLLRAANLTSIDYFSLDVEGNELNILKEFPFSDFDIKVSPPT